MLPHRWMANRLGLLASQPWWFQRCENWAMCQQSTFQIFCSQGVDSTWWYAPGSQRAVCAGLTCRKPRKQNWAFQESFCFSKDLSLVLMQRVDIFSSHLSSGLKPRMNVKKKGKYFPEKKHITMQYHRISTGGSSVISLHCWGMGALSSTALCRPLLIWRWNWRGQQMGEETQGTRDGYRATMVYPMLFDG